MTSTLASAFRPASRTGYTIHTPYGTVNEIKDLYRGAITQVLISRRVAAVIFEATNGC
jgi:hypothetical protein